MIWRVATVLSVLAESTTARTLVLWIPGWPGHLAGQHIDVKLTAQDGYSAVRSYSICSAPSGSLERPGETIEITVEQSDSGEVSPYLVHDLAEGDEVEIRGPFGGWFVWRPSQREPIQLVAGGSGIAPVMAIVRAGVAAADAEPGRTPMRLLYSTRSPESLLHGDELTRLAAERRLDLTIVFTRAAPEGWTRAPRRIDVDLLPAVTWRGGAQPTCYVCGPDAFVETAVRLLQAARHPNGSIRTERFGSP